MAASDATTTRAATGSKTPVKPKTTTPTPKQTISHTSQVTIMGMQFSPLVLAINAGDTVVWINKDVVPHTTKADLGLLWDSGTILPGSSFSHVFRAPGSYTYSCGIHPTMHGTIIVR
jgi:plastocyanin